VSAIETSESKELRHGLHGVAPAQSTDGDTFPRAPRHFCGKITLSWTRHLTRRLADGPTSARPSGGLVAAASAEDAAEARCLRGAGTLGLSTPRACWHFFDWCAAQSASRYLRFNRINAWIARQPGSTRLRAHPDPENRWRRGSSEPARKRILTILSTSKRWTALRISLNDALPDAAGSRDDSLCERRPPGRNGS
jgi:hypothetical protein